MKEMQYMELKKQLVNKYVNEESEDNLIYLVDSNERLIVGINSIDAIDSNIVTESEINKGKVNEYIMKNLIMEMLESKKNIVVIDIEGMLNKFFNLVEDLDRQMKIEYCDKFYDNIVTKYRVEFNRGCITD